MNKEIFLLLCFCCIFLIACNKPQNLAEKPERSTEEMESILNEYENNIDQLIEENADLKLQLEKMTEALEDLKEKDTTEIIVDTKDLITVDGHRFRISYAGQEVLEDGIVIVLEAYDSENQVLWIKTWEGIQVSELPLISQPSIYENKIYIVIDGNLNIINLKTGEILKTIETVGHSDASPMIDQKGTVFTIGQYKPYVTAINAEGKIIWQIEDDKFLNAYAIELIDQMLQIKTFNGTYILNKDGAVIED
jgi:hypothetical protein